MRMNWAAYREMTRREDIAYYLLGIFNINMPIMYGERKEAFIRLQEEILKVTDDFSIFAWNHKEGFHPRYSRTGGSLNFAYFPFEVLEGDILSTPFKALVPDHEEAIFTVSNKSIVVDNQGIRLRLPLFRNRLLAP